MDIVSIAIAKKQAIEQGSTTTGDLIGQDPNDETGGLVTAGTISGLDSTLESSTHAAPAKVVGDALDTKVDKSALFDAGIKSITWTVSRSQISVTTVEDIYKQYRPTGTDTRYWAEFEGCPYFINRKLYRVTFDGTVYDNLVCDYGILIDDGAGSVVGNDTTIGGAWQLVGNKHLYDSRYEDTGEPFCVIYVEHGGMHQQGSYYYSSTVGHGILFTETAKSCTLKIETATITQDELPKSLFNNYGFGDRTYQNIGSSTYPRVSLGLGNIIGRGSFSIGCSNISTGQFAFASGAHNTANGSASHAEGSRCVSSNTYSHAEGHRTIASGQCSHSQGETTTASGVHAHAQGSYLGEYNSTSFTIASGTGSHAQGLSTTASGSGSHAQGAGSVASGEYSHAQGCHTGYWSEPIKTTASGSGSHAQGAGTSATSIASHSQGRNTIASGKYSHAQGKATISQGQASHSEGVQTKSTNNYSHSQGCYCIASGLASHAEGGPSNISNPTFITTASGQYSHAQGVSHADGTVSHSQGGFTIANGRYQHVQGKYNVQDNNDLYAHIVGNGSKTARSNAHTLDWSGNAWYAGNVQCTYLILKSPSNKRFMLTVGDDGVLTTTEVTE